MTSDTGSAPGGVDAEWAVELAHGLRAVGHYINNITTSIYGRAQLAQLSGGKSLDKLVDTCMNETPKITAALTALRKLNEKLQTVEDTASGETTADVAQELKDIIDLTGPDRS